MWGAGGNVQQDRARRQRRNGGQVIFFDLGYFGRSNATSADSIRLSINGNHPQKYAHLAPKDPSRFNKLPFNIEALYKPDGHIVLCGLGRKSRQLYGYNGMEWERKMVSRIKEAFPESLITYRPKPKHDESLVGTRKGNAGTIRDVINGASLVVCHHSNVSIDCALLGVPCVCFDGLGSNLWGNVIEEGIELPSVEERKAFLENAAWFNWYIHESPEILHFIDSIAEKIN